MEASNAIGSNIEEQYTFRFVSSNQLIHLTQEQVDRIPYLSVLLAHKNDFLSIENENGEYVLKPPLEYYSLTSILRSITSNNPYELFDKLPENVNILNTLKLFDYLGLQSFPLPFLKDTNLIRSNPDQNKNDNENKNEKQRVKYCKVTLSEARQIAAQFVIGLAKNEYQLDDTNTTNNIFKLINIIFSHSDVFCSTFRCHTFNIARKCCYPFFSKDQRRWLQNTRRNTQHRRRTSSKYLSNSNKPLPAHFENAFTWKSVPAPIEDDQTDWFSASFIERSYFPISYTSSLLYPRIWLYRIRQRIKLVPSGWYRFLYPNSLFSLIPGRTQIDADITRLIEEQKRDRRKEQAQSARSGRFNTIPKRPKIDKFQHRRGPKAQKYR